MSWTIMRGDAMHIPLGDETVQMVATSPPFCGLRQYQGVAPTLWPLVTYAPMAGLAPITVPEMTCCFGLEAMPEAYIGHLVAIFREVRRVLRDDGTLWLNLGDSYGGPANNNRSGLGGIKDRGGTAIHHGRKVLGGTRAKDLIGIPWRVALALQADGWYLRSDIIWNKPDPMPESVRDRPTKAHEYIFLLAKSADYFWDQEAVREPHVRLWDETNGGSISTGRMVNAEGAMGDMSTHPKGYPLPNPAGRNIRSVWTQATQPYSGSHFAVWPPSLVAKMIAAGTSERGCCSRCGTPWHRVVAKVSESNADSPRGKYDALDASGAHHGQNGRRGVSGSFSNNHKLRPGSPATIGWRPSCSCDAGEPVPCVVADIFSGAGTTVMQALRMGRSAVGLDLSHEYCDMARDRIIADCPLFNAVDAAK